ncbi:conserved exported hypothetical protein [Thiomonas arsenitoxydans]|uniref:Uncharacterized protein n=1 Tax=Thiomonas arsenitoxydans (strain DSM 22701 / CIP 110005 / 3As) TaxID=426114 RepID=A0ABM9T2G9_THIA3|nr:conserved exported hypothetical protein [Thiomonas arsenitoxydans]
MRHFVLTRPPEPLPLRVRVPPPQRRLVTPPSRTQRLAARLLRAAIGAIPVAAVAAAADQHGAAAVRTEIAAGWNVHRQRGR